MTAVFAPYRHESPEPRHIPADLTDVKLLARSISSRLLTGVLCPAMQDVIISGAPVEDEDPLLADFREAVIDTIPNLVSDFGIRLRVITNARKAKAQRKSQTGTLLNNFHTDTDLTLTAKGIELLKKKQGRITATFDGAGTLVMSGAVEAQSTQPYVHSAVYAGRSPEQQMASIAPAITGHEGQLIRGPKVNEGLFELGGGFTIASLLPDRWYELDPDTVHAIPENLTLGRITVNVDRA